MNRKLLGMFMSSFYARLGLALVGVLIVLWLGLGSIAMEKLITRLLMPAGVVWILLGILAIATLRSRHLGRSIMAVSAWLVFTTAGNSHVAGWLAHSREGRYAEIDVMRQGDFDVVIVLGGGASQGGARREQGNAAGDRLILAAQIYHAGLTSELICTGRRIAEMDASGLDPAGRSAAILRGLGVPADAISFAGGRNTSEEMRDLAVKFGGGEKRVGLLTSAWHLSRAERLAKKHGLDLVPLPADFVNGPSGSSRTVAASLKSFVPSADALVVSTKILKEYLADLAGR